MWTGLTRYAGPDQKAATVPPRSPRLLPAKSAHQVHDETDKENEANAAAANGGAAEIESTAADQQEDDDDKKKRIHTPW